MYRNLSRTTIKDCYFQFEWYLRTERLWMWCIKFVFVAFQFYHRYFLCHRFAALFHHLSAVEASLVLRCAPSIHLGLITKFQSWDFTPSNTVPVLTRPLRQSNWARPRRSNLEIIVLYFVANTETCLLRERRTETRQREIKTKNSNSTRRLSGARSKESAAL